MTTHQEALTFPQWDVDDTDDFISILQNNLTGENQSQMAPFEKNMTGIQVSPFENKVKTMNDQNTIEMDKMLSNLTQQDPKICENPDKQLSEVERIDQMNENEVIDYLVDLMQEEPSDPQKLPFLPLTSGFLEDSLVQRTVQCTEVKDLPGANSVQTDILENSYVKNKSQFTGVEQLPNTNLAQIDTPEKGNSLHIMLYGNVKQLPDASLKTCEISSKSKIRNPIPSNNIMGDIFSSFQHPSQSHQTNQNNQNNKDRIHQSSRLNEIKYKQINQDRSNQLHLGIDNENTQNKVNDRTIFIQNTTPSNKHEYILNRNVNNVQAAPVEKRVKTIDTKKLIEMVQAQNKAFRINKGRAIDKGPLIQQKITLQNQIKLPILNKEKEISTKNQTFNIPSKVVEVKLDNEQNYSETTITKKRKKYEEEPEGEEEKKILQAKKAKNYREKKKEEFKMKDIQIKNLQEALQKSEREKKAYINENKQLKEDLKKKDLLLQLYEVN